MLSFINFEPLEFYWTYFLALQTTTPKILPMGLMSLDHEPKNEMMCYELKPWALTPFLCKYELFWALEEIFPKSMIVLTWCGSPMKWNHVVCKICHQQLLLINMNYVEFFFSFFRNFIDKKFDKIFHTCWYGRLIMVSKKVVLVVNLDEN